MPLLSVSPLKLAVQASVTPSLVAEVLPEPEKVVLFGVRCQAAAGPIPAMPKESTAMSAMAGFMAFDPSLIGAEAPGGGATAPPVTKSLRFGDRGIGKSRRHF